MSKKGLEKFYKEVLPILKQKYKTSSNYGDIYFDNYDAKCFIKKSNGQIEEVYLFKIEGVNQVETNHPMLNRLLNPFTEPKVIMLSDQYRWAGDCGRTWALIKEELE